MDADNPSLNRSWTPDEFIQEVTRIIVDTAGQEATDQTPLLFEVAKRGSQAET